MRRDGWEPISNFNKALKEEEYRIRNNWSFSWHYSRLGFYHEQLTRYFDYFDKNQIKVFLYEDFKDNSDVFFQELFAFIGVGNISIQNSSKNQKLKSPLSFPQEATFCVYP